MNLISVIKCSTNDELYSKQIKYNHDVYVALPNVETILVEMMPFIGFRVVEMVVLAVKDILEELAGTVMLLTTVMMPMVLYFLMKPMLDAI